MPKIVFSDPHILGNTTGGAEVQLWMLATGFQRAGWDVHYVTDMPVSEDEREGVMLHRIESSSKQSAFSIYNEIQPDIIYQRGRKSHTEFAGHYAKEKNIPFIFAASMDIDCRYFKETGRLLTQSLSLKAKARLLLKRVRQDLSSLKGMKNASLILAQSRLQKGLLKKNLALESQVFRNLHPVPDINEIRKDDTPLVLWLASVKQWKRPELFIELAESLKGKPYHFILAGRLADRGVYEDVLVDYTKRNPNFDYIENIDLEGSNQLIARASIFINTSEPFEGFPNTFIQSWLRETVVLSLLVDPDDLITSHALGAVSGNLESMSDKVNALLEAPDELKGLAFNTRNFAINEFGLKKNFSHIENIARELIDQRNG